MKLLLKTLDQIKAEFKTEEKDNYGDIGLRIYHDDDKPYFINEKMYKFFGTIMDVKWAVGKYDYKTTSPNNVWSWKKEWFNESIEFIDEKEMSI